MNEFLSAETITALISHMNTSITEEDFVGDDDEQDGSVATRTEPIEEALGYTYHNRVHGSVKYAET